MLCSQVAGLSVSSSFFSPSGKTMLTTSFANRLNLTDDMHLRSTGMIQPTHSIRHNNQTGKLNLAIYWYICAVEVITVVSNETNWIRIILPPFSMTVLFWFLSFLSHLFRVLYLLLHPFLVLLGRWLTTFQATWHPVVDIFCCGSMNKPRCMEIFDGQGRLLREMRGESLSSVMSRTCFHPSTDKLVMIGGNSSGRVVVVR